MVTVPPGHCWPVINLLNALGEYGFQITNCSSEIVRRPLHFLRMMEHASRLTFKNILNAHILPLSHTTVGLGLRALNGRTVILISSGRENPPRQSDFNTEQCGCIASSRRHPEIH